VNDVARDYKSLEDYGLIGNLETCALIGRDGSIDWCCLPHLESPSVFAAILDVEKGGHFRLKPRDHSDGKQAYVRRTNVLQTTFETPSGTVTLTDFMPVKDEAHSLHRAILRKATCQQGRVELEIEFKPRFDYARAVPVLEPTNDGAIARWQKESLFLQSPFPLELGEGEARGIFTMGEGETGWFIVRYGDEVPIGPEECESLLDRTVQYWSEWAHHCQTGRCVFRGPWHHHVVRSGLVLKLLTHPESGAIAAAPTTSLPEVIGGVRNWDYRFAWVRDASFTVKALYNAGHIEEAMHYFQWIRDLTHTHAEDTDRFEMQIMYGLHGESDLEEWELDHLSGYRNSAPVRIGNAAVNQKQLDVYGELVNAFYETRRMGEGVSPEDWHYICTVADHVCQIWNTTDFGIWEVRGGPRHFTYSKLMCWVALDHSIKMAEERGFEAPLEKWKKTSEEIRQAILDRGFSQKLNSFVQSYDSETLDATSLLIPVMGFLPPDDPRVQGTIEATLEHLTTNGMVYRYLGDDGLPGQEGTFVLCTFWLVDALILSGQVERAEELFLNVLKYTSPLGLLAEEIDPVSGHQLGNYPQAFSHIGLMNSAMRLSWAKLAKREAMNPKEARGRVKNGNTS
jgi:GH15 family glucan-1,4-alpha-glucosidase